MLSKKKKKKNIVSLYILYDSPCLFPLFSVILSLLLFLNMYYEELWYIYFTLYNKHKWCLGQYKIKYHELNKIILWRRGTWLRKPLMELHNVKKWELENQ
jgi:hypothetical protein